MSNPRASAALLLLVAVCASYGRPARADSVSAPAKDAPPEAQGAQAEGPPGTAGVDEPVKGLLFGAPDSFLSLELHGFVNVEAYYFQDEAEHPAPSFDLHNFYLATKARIGKDVAVFGEVEYEHGATVRVDRAFVDWAPVPWFNARVGRFYVPMSYERAHYWAPVRLMTSRPLLVDVPFHEWSDTGIELLGRISWFGYDISLVNGPRGLTESGVPNLDVRDNNRNKVVVARATFKPFRILELGVAYSQGLYDDDNSRRFRLVEADMRLRGGPFEIWSEYDRRFGDDEPCSPESDPGCSEYYAGDTARKQGFYVLGAVTVLKGQKFVNYLKPMARFDAFDDIDRGTGQRRVTAGLSWSPIQHLILRGEYQVTREVGERQLRNDGAMFSTVADF